MKPSPFWLGASPAVFVFLWSTGFIGATYGLPYAEPWTFLSYRFAIVAVLLVAFSLATRAPWPATPKACLQNAFVGVLIHGIYLGGVFAAIARGMPTGLAALIIGLQPALTAVGGPAGAGRAGLTPAMDGHSPGVRRHGPRGRQQGGGRRHHGLAARTPLRSP